MSMLRVYWNLVDANRQVDLNMLARTDSQKLVTRVSSIGDQCRGVLFRSVLREELDFSGFLDQIRLEDVRKARRDPDNTLLYRPKKEENKSIGVLRIVRPKRFSVAKKSQFSGVGGPGSLPSIAVPFETPTKEFEVLLESTEFILEDVQEQMAERFQLQETFGDFNVFFFGKRAEIYTYSGSLLNADGNLQWRNQFLDNYERFLRGTRAAELKARVYLLYDDVIREGFILSAGIAQNSFTEGVVKFNFTMLITGKRILGQIPKNPTADPIETLAGTVDPRTGISEFQFIRSLNPDLPQVFESLTDEPLPQSFPLIQNDSIPGTEAPADLKQLMTTRSLNAMNLFLTSGEIQGTLQTGLDHDVLIDFIDSRQLAGLLTTSSIMVGARTQDADNLTGEQLYAVLRSGARTVDDLKLSEAVKVADTFARSHRQTIGGILADNLTRLHNLFEPNSTDRIITPVGPSFDQDVIFANKTYVLLGQGNPSNKDKVNLKTLVESTANLRTFKKDETNAIVIDSVNVGVIPPLLKASTKRNDAEVIQLYVAAFLLIKDPQVGGTLFPAITANFPDAPSRSENALAYLDKQQIKFYEKVVEDLPGQVADALTAVISDVEGSWLLKVMDERVVGTKRTFVLSEDLIRQSTLASPVPGVSGSTSAASADFLQRISIYLTGIAAERANIGRKTTLDVVTGTTKSPSGDLDNAYFTNNYHDQIAIGGQRAAGLEAVSLKTSTGDLTTVLVDSKVGDGSKYIVFPVGLTAGPVVIAPQFFIIGISEFQRGVTIDKVGDVKDSRLKLAGYTKVTPDQLAFIPEEQTLYSLVLKRKTLKTIPKEYEVRTNEALGLSTLDHFKTGGGELIESVILPDEFRKQILKESFFMPGFMPRRSFLGSATVPYDRPTLELIEKVVVLDLNFFLFQRFKPMIDEVKSQVNRIVSDAAFRRAVGEDIDLRETFALENFTGVEAQAINSVNAELKTIGVTVDDYFSFVFMAEAHRTMALQLENLQTFLKDAVLRVTDGAGSRAEDVEASDRELKDIVCQPR